MPDCGYIATPPYRLRDRIYAHTGTVITAIWSFLAGISLAMDALIPGLDVSTVLRAMPDAAKLWLSLTLTIGGALASVGMLCTWKRLDYSWRVEQGGWWLILGGWATLAVVVCLYSPASFLAWGTFLTFAVVAFIRQVVVRRSERSTMQAIDEAAE